MANEIVISADPADTGLTVTADILSDAGVSLATGVALTEVSSTAIYRADMPTAAAGTYFIRYLNGGVFWFQEEKVWDGASFGASSDSMVSDIWQDMGLDSANPKTITEVIEGSDYNEDVDSIHKDVVSTGTITTITRA